jgi:hypothetical protein
MWRREEKYWKKGREWEREWKQSSIFLSFEDFELGARKRKRVLIHICNKFTKQHDVDLSAHHVCEIVRFHSPRRVPHSR